MARSDERFEHGAEACNHAIRGTVAFAARIRRFEAEIYEVMIGKCEWGVMQRGVDGISDAVCLFVACAA